MTVPTGLIIEDDPTLLRGLKDNFQSHAYDVRTASDGRKGLEAVLDCPPDLVLLDIMLPEKDGFEVLREIRTAHALPVIMLTAKGEDADRIVGLELGADDYLPTPVNPRELLARVRAVLRRPPRLEDAESKEDRLISVGGMSLNTAKQVLLVEGKEVELSSTEYKVLEALMKHPNVVMTRDQLMTLARGRDFMAFDRSIDVHISKLRAKLKAHPKYGRCIKTVWGTGYMFVEAP